MDRFTKFNDQEQTCFLCLKKADDLCESCSIPYCSKEHFSVHRKESEDQNDYCCYPFRILQRPEVLTSYNWFHIGQFIAIVCV